MLIYICYCMLLCSNIVAINYQILVISYICCAEKMVHLESSSSRKTALIKYILIAAQAKLLQDCMYATATTFSICYYFYSFFFTTSVECMWRYLRVECYFRAQRETSSKNAAQMLNSHTVFWT